MNRKSMKGAVLLLAAVITLPAAGSPVRGGEYPEDGHGWVIDHYDLDVRIDYGEEKMYGRAVITVTNGTGGELDEVPLLLYRLMNVSSVTDPGGGPVEFVQNVVTFEDNDRIQSNFITVRLPEPVAPGKSTSIRVEYSGYMFGRSEVYGYVRETIDPAFTMIRDDADAYPWIGYPSRLANMRRHLQRYTYDARITVPDSLVVANGGRLAGRSSEGGMTTWHYTSRKPSWRQDYAIADYYRETSGKNSVFCLREDSARAGAILDAMDRTIDLFTKWWGPLKSYDGLTVIEIPEGYGSQTDVTTIIQRAEVFRDDAKMFELYHELSHKWNVKATDRHPPRIEEGLGVFIQSLAVEELEDREYLDGYMDKVLDYLRRVYVKRPEYAEVPISEFGEKDMGGMSYTTGALFFYLLYNIAGAEDFNGIIRSYYEDRYESGGTTEDLMDHIRAGTGADVSKLIDDWIYSTVYADLIRGGADAAGLRDIYM